MKMLLTAFSCSARSLLTASVIYKARPLKHIRVDLLAGLGILLVLLIPSGRAGAASYTLTLNTVGSGTVLRNPTNSVYPSGVTVTLTAISNDATWYFSSWSGDASGAGNPLNVQMLSDKVITATFVQLPTYALTLATNGQGTITLSPPGGIYASNTPVTVTATPTSGWVFTGWSGDTTGAANPVSVTMSRNLALTANFTQFPVIDVQPQSVTNILGSTVSFSAHATGSPPLAYQWYFNNGPLRDATSSTLTVSNVTFTDAGNYWLVATNSGGSATSSVVALVLSQVGSTNAVEVCTEAALRAAIAVGGWVSINCNGTFTLSDTIRITNSVILDAQNASAAISGNNLVRIFYVTPGASLTANRLTLANGMVTNHPADGGAIYNDHGVVSFVSCILTNNNALIQMSSSGTNVMRGGAIFNQGGTVSLFGCGISNNAATAWDQVESQSWFGYGGAIYNADGVIQMVGCICSSNTCAAVQDGPIGSAMGGAVFQASGTLSVSNSMFTQNQALNRDLANAVVYLQQAGAGSGCGGALCATGGVVAIDHSVFTGNTAKGCDSERPTSGLGGAIYCSSVLTVESSSFAWNRALSGDYGFWNVSSGQGGAIYSSVLAILNHSSIYSNYVQGSAGNIFGALPSVPGGDGLGGGIYNAGLLMVTNCTLALNSAIAGSGTYAPWFDPTPGNNGNALGGGVYNGTNATSLWMNDTIASNFCIATGSGFTGTNGYSAGAQVANTNGTMWLRNSLLAYGGTNGNVWGTQVTDAGFNISDDGTAAFASGASYNFTDPMLGPLADYGGPTLCMALLPESPAIDTGDNSGAPATDQRWFARPYNFVVDMGAYEFSGTNQVVYQPMLNLTPAGPILVLSFRAYPSSTYYLQASTNLRWWTDLETNGPFAIPTTITRTITPSAGQRQFYRVWLQ